MSLLVERPSMATPTDALLVLSSSMRLLVALPPTIATFTSKGFEDWPATTAAVSPAPRRRLMAGAASVPASYISEAARFLFSCPLQAALGVKEDIKSA